MSWCTNFSQVLTTWVLFASFSTVVEKEITPIYIDRLKHFAHSNNLTPNSLIRHFSTQTREQYYSFQNSQSPVFAKFCSSNMSWNKCNPHVSPTSSPRLPNVFPTSLAHWYLSSWWNNHSSVNPSKYCSRQRSTCCIAVATINWYSQIIKFRCSCCTWIWQVAVCEMVSGWTGIW